MIYAFTEMYDSVYSALFEAFRNEKIKVIADSASAIAGQSVKVNGTLDYG